ncbi:hypothetical protein ACHAWF_014846 [Thalassiosira exigua]
MMPRLLFLAIPLTCVAAFTLRQNAKYEGRTRTSLGAMKKSQEFAAQVVSSRRATIASLVGMALTAQGASASVQSNMDSSGVLLAAGAYQAEAGYDFSDGLSLPKYNVDKQIGLKTSDVGEVDPAKLEKMKEKAAAAAAKAEAKKEAAAAKKAALAAAEAAKKEANAAKIAAKQEAKARQLATMSPEQRAKIEAYNAAKAEGKKQPSAMDNMKRMYGL